VIASGHKINVIEGSDKSCDDSLDMGAKEGGQISSINPSSIHTSNIPSI
jgi:hypothetical protein